MNKIELIALDSDFNIVSILEPFNIQWTRDFYKSGIFSVEIPVEQYRDTFKYIYTKDRPEVGEISQINYIQTNGEKIFAISGYFLEEELNRRICYHKPNGNTNLRNAPSWTSQSGNDESIAFAFFNAFKDISFDSSTTVRLGIETGTNLNRGNASEYTRNNELLGDKLHSILKGSEMSYVVAYDFVNNTKTFKCIKGNDLTSENEDGNNPVVFSTRYGNIVNPNIVWSDTDYKNGYVVTAKYTNSNVDYVDVQVGGTNPTRFMAVNSSEKPNDYSSAAAFKTALLSNGKEQIRKKPIKMSFDFDIMQGSYTYLEDFNLGDKVTIVVNELGISTDAILTECAEVFKNGTWSLTMQFDI